MSLGRTTRRRVSATAYDDLAYGAHVSCVMRQRLLLSCIVLRSDVLEGFVDGSGNLAVRAVIGSIFTDLDWRNVTVTLVETALLDWSVTL